MTLPADDECPGAGKCHGCMRWCDHCGDVGEICDATRCAAHRCERCNRILTAEEQWFERDWWMWCHPCSVAVAMEQARDRGENEIDAGLAREAAIAANAARLL